MGKKDFLNKVTDISVKDKLKYLLTKDVITGVPRKTNIEELTLTFLGATKTVTGSKYLVEYKKTKILLDCGMFQGLKDERLKNRQEMPIHPKNIDAIVLTHGHLDHCGLIPLIVKNGFRGKVYCTDATYEICKLVLPDSGFLQEEDAKYARKKGFAKHKNPEALYNEEDAIKSLKYFHPVSFNKEFNISNDMTARFIQDGHILGSGNVMVKANGKSILFSGDLGRQDDPILYPPKPAETADYIVVESTYGNRKHLDIDPMDELEKLINKTIKRGGNIIMPAFAVGRSQNILYYLHQLKKQNRIPNITVFLDSPMSIKATNLLDDFANEHKLNRDECYEIYNNTKFTVTQQQSKKIFDYIMPSIIISASGMATGGRVLHHIEHYAPNPANMIVFAGFQAAGTRGRDMVEGKREIKMHGQIIPIRADVYNLENVSAHADCDEIIDWLKGFKKAPKKVFITHGEESAAFALADKVDKELNYKAIVPDYLQTEKL